MPDYRIQARYGSRPPTPGVAGTRWRASNRRAPSFGPARRWMNCAALRGARREAGSRRVAKPPPGLRPAREDLACDGAAEVPIVALDNLGTPFQPAGEPSRATCGSKRSPACGCWMYATPAFLQLIVDPSSGSPEPVFDRVYRTPLVGKKKHHQTQRRTSPRRPQAGRTLSRPDRFIKDDELQADALTALR